MNELALTDYLFCISHALCRSHICKGLMYLLTTNDVLTTIDVLIDPYEVGYDGHAFTCEKN